MSRLERLPSGLLVPRMSRRQLLRAGLAAGVFLGTKKARAAWLMNSSRFGGVALTGAETLAAGEAQALSFDFTDQSTLILDTTTPANNYTGVPDGKLTYTAPSVKLCRQSDGVYRYNNHNLCLQSQTLDSATWVKFNSSITADATTAPDGTSTADKLVANATNGIHSLRQDSVGGSVVGATHTFSVYAKPAGYDWIEIAVANSLSFNQFYSTSFNVATGAVGTARSTTWTGSSSITSVGSGWYLCTITVQTSVNAAGTVLLVTNPADNFAVGYVGDTVSGGYFWGAQQKRFPVQEPAGLARYLATTTAARFLLPYEWSTALVLQGLLIEEARTNLLLRSREFDNASWVKTNMTITADSIAGFDGQTQADTLTATAANATVNQNGASNATDDGRHATVFLQRKTGTGTVTLAVGHIVTTCVLTAAMQRFEARGAGLAGTYVLATNVVTVTATGHGLVTGDIIRFQKLTGGAGALSAASITFIDANTFSFAQALADTSGTCNIYANTLRIKLATSGDEVYADQAQLEVRTLTGQNFPSSPIITTTATVTRVADSINIATSLFPYSATQGSAYARFSVRNLNGSSRVVLGFGDGTTNEIVQLTATTSMLLGVTDGGVSQASIADGAPTPDSFDRMAVRWAVNDFAISGNGGAVSTDGSGTLPTMNTLRLGDRTAGSAVFHGYLSHVLYLPRTMLNAELISRTT